MISQFKPDLEKYERERILFETIKNNPNLHHNALIKQIVPKFMAKTTFEKTRDSLMKKEIIQVRLKGNMKFYHILENYDLKSQQHLERNTNNSFHDLKLLIKRLETDYPHKDIDEKIATAISLLRNLLNTDNGFTVLDAAKNPKKTLYRDEHLIIQQLIHKVFEVIRHDHDFEMIFPTIVSHMGLLIPKDQSEK